MSDEKIIRPGEVLRLYRKQSRLTQQQLSDMTGIDPATIRKYENGQNRLTEKAASRFEKALKIERYSIPTFPISKKRLDYYYSLVFTIHSKS